MKLKVRNIEIGPNTTVSSAFFNFTKINSATFISLIFTSI